MTRLGQGAEPRRPAFKTVVNLLLVFVLLYLFLGGIGMLGQGVKELSKNPQYNKDAPAEGVRKYRDVVYEVFSYAENPLVGLFIGILATSIFQSSSFTTSFAVSLVVTTPLTLHQAIPIIMGANIGTSVTAVGVSFAHVRRADEFERAYGAAIVHDFYKTLTVLLLFPLEWIVWRLTGQGFLERLSLALARTFSGGAAAGEEPTNVLRVVVNPLVQGAERLLGDGLGLGHVPVNIVLTVLGLVLLFAALIYLTVILRNLVLLRVERVFDQVLFRNAAAAFVVGLALTSVVQSSSVTTSLAVPLAGAGLLTISQVYPYMLGAAIGTTVTALIASFATSADTPALAEVGVALAFAHTLFNVLGSAVWYLFRRVPISMATWFARIAGHSSRWAVMYVAGFFFVLPILVIGAYWLLK
jgi:sodium-dependent phosphate cotransporter